MLIAAHILNHENYFQVDGARAKFDPNKKILVTDSNAPKATDDEIKEIATARIRPLLTDKNGVVYTLKEKEITLEKYLRNNKKTGYANLPLKLFYVILDNTEKASKITAEEVSKDLKLAKDFIIPVSGFGLWAPIYGYLAIGPDGDTIIGTTWYDMGETPGLGANITEAWWQNKFPGKFIFRRGNDGKSDYKSAEMGIIVVKGRVQNVFGTSARASNAVDGISGATLTGDGVTSAYQDSLSPYRAFLIKLHDSASVGNKEDSKTKAEEKS